MKNEQGKREIITITTDVQTDERKTLDKQTSVSPSEYQDQSTETNPIKYKDQQTQFNLAIQRAMQNATQAQKKQILQLEQQLADKRNKINKLKEWVKKLQNFYTLSPTPPPILPLVDNSLITSSMDDEQQQINQDEPIITTNETATTTTTTRQAFLKRSEPIAMPSSFIVQSMLAAGNTVSSPKM